MDTVDNENSEYPYNLARDKIITFKNVKARWSEAGLFSLNPDKVRQDIQKPTAKLKRPES